MIPAGVTHDPVSAVIIRDGRAVRLRPTCNMVMADLLAAGGEAAVDDLGRLRKLDQRYTAMRARAELRVANPALRRLSLKAAISPLGMVRLVEIRARRP